MDNNIIGHIETHLGEMIGGWTDIARHGIGVSLFKKRVRNEEYSVTVTVGLSNHILHQSSGKNLRQELMIVTTDDMRRYGERIAELLAMLCDEIIDRHAAVSIWDVLHSFSEVIPGSPIRSVFARPADVFPEEFAIIDTDPPTVFVWLVPILSEEYEFIKTIGREEFDKLIVDRMPKIYSWKRASILEL